jgi:hypothetical protein
MNKLTAPIVALALLGAACTGTATISGSSVKSVAGSNAVQLPGAANAGDENSDITNRPNPPVRKGGTTQVKPVTPQNAAPAAPQPAFGPATDRCGSGIGTSGAGNRASTTGQPKHPPLPMCAVD